MKGTNYHPAQNDIDLIHHEGNIVSTECKDLVSILNEYNGKYLTIKDNISKVILYKNKHSESINVKIFYSDDSGITILKWFSEEHLVVLNRDIWYNENNYLLYEYIHKLLSLFDEFVSYYNIEFDSLM